MDDKTEGTEEVSSPAQPESDEAQIAQRTVDTNAVEATEVSQSDPVAQEEDETMTVDPAVIEKLTLGVMELFLPNLQKAKGQLNEVLHNQEVLIETVQTENSKFTDSVAMKKLADTMSQARLYHNKLINLKREMNALTEKSTRLRKRAVKLQQQKQKEELHRAQQREKEFEKERMLTAKVATKPKESQQ